MKENGQVVFFETNKENSRLDYLRSLSSELNKSLQSKAEQAGLPIYFWNKSSKDQCDTLVGKKKNLPHPKVMRLAILFRPEFVRTDEVKNSRNRYTTASDQLTWFIHLDTNNTIQMIRRYNKLGRHREYPYDAFLDNFFYGILPKPFLQYETDAEEAERQCFEKYIKEEAVESLADLVITRLISSPGTQETPIQMNLKDFQRAAQLTSVAQVKDYFSDAVFVVIPPEFVRNLTKMAIFSVLETCLDLYLVRNVQPNFVKLKKSLEQEAEKLLDVEVREFNYGRGGGSIIKKIREFFPGGDMYCKQIISHLLAEAKPYVMGWIK